ncbi:MAG: PaRep2b protein [Desulfurococcaceae archaeon]
MQRLYELFVEAVAKALDYVRAHWFILAAVAAGLIGWAVAQQLDFTLWQDHVALNAGAIAGLAAEWKVKPSLADEAEGAPSVVKEAALKALEAVRELLKAPTSDNAERAYNATMELAKLVKTNAVQGGIFGKMRKFDSVKDAAALFIARALLEEALRPLLEARRAVEEAERTVKEKARDWREGSLSIAQEAEAVRRLREAAEEAEVRLGRALETLAEVDKRFEPRRYAEELAKAARDDLAKYGDTSWGDKILASVIALGVRDSPWLRAVGEAIRRRELEELIQLMPSSIYRKFARELRRPSAKDPVAEALIRLMWSSLETLAVERGEEGLKVRTSMDEFEVKIREIKGRYIMRIKGIKGKIPTVSLGLAQIEPVLYGQLVTDLGYEVNKNAISSTNNPMQAVLYKSLGLNVKPSGMGDLTKSGEIHLTYRVSGGRETLEKIFKRWSEVLKKLKTDKGQRALEEAVLRATEALKKIEKNIEGNTKEFLREVEKALSELKGNGIQTILNLDFTRHAPYARVLMPLIDGVINRWDEREFALFLTSAILGDGGKYGNYVVLTAGHFQRRRGEELPLTLTHKAAAWLTLLAKYGYPPDRIYLTRQRDEKGVVREWAYFVWRADRLGRPFALSADLLTSLQELRLGDNIYIKVKKMLEVAKEYANALEVERDQLDTRGMRPKTKIRFKMGNKTVAHISLYWDGESLRAIFPGSRENAERLASIIKTLGGKAEIKQRRAGWTVELYTDGITTIRHSGWLNAVRSFIEELHNKRLISDERYEQLIKDIIAGPNTVEFAGVKFSVYYRKREDKSDEIIVVYQPMKDTAKDAAVNSLSARGLREGEHFTVKEKSGEYVIRVKRGHRGAVVEALKAAGLREGKDFTEEGNKVYTIRITSKGLQEIYRMALRGDKEAVRFIREVEDALKRWYGQNAVERLRDILRPVRGEDTIDLPVPVSDKNGNVVARIVNLKYEFIRDGNPVDHCQNVGCRLRITVEYETVAEGERDQVVAEWYWKEKRLKTKQGIVTHYYETAVLSVKDDIKVAVLKTLTGREVEKGRVELTARDLEAMRRFKAIKDAIDQWRKGRPMSSQAQDSERK